MGFGSPCGLALGRELAVGMNKLVHWLVSHLGCGKLVGFVFQWRWSKHRFFEDCLMFLHDLHAWFCNTWNESCSCERNNNRDGLKTPIVHTFD